MATRRWARSRCVIRERPATIRIAGSLARAKRLTVYEAALGLWDTMDLTVHVFADGSTAIWCPRQSICGGELHNWVPMDLD
ncbi:MAG: hypothetical protein AAGC60_24410 [Acidobacteriota bacterium]